MLTCYAGGYFYAKTTGIYTFWTTQVDDYIYLWAGDTARAGWDANNANCRSIPNRNECDFTINISAGTYLPLRALFFNGPGGGTWGLVVVDPDGNTIVDPSTESPLMVRYSCDGTTAPPYTTSFGQES